METIRGSVWLRPTGPVLERLQELIRRLTRRFGGTWPRPHVSLLDGVELKTGGAEQRLALLAERLPAVPVRLGRLEGRNEPLRCFYAQVEPTPELLDARRLACEAFGVAAPDRYEPHLSLLYGHVDAPTKARLAQELGGRLSLSFVAGSVHLVNATAITLYECALRRPGRPRPPHRSLTV